MIPGGVSTSLGIDGCQQQVREFLYVDHSADRIVRSNRSHKIPRHSELGIVADVIVRRIRHLAGSPLNSPWKDTLQRSPNRVSLIAFAHIHGGGHRQAELQNSLIEQRSAPGEERYRLATVKGMFAQPVPDRRKLIRPLEWRMIYPGWSGLVLPLEIIRQQHHGLPTAEGSQSIQDLSSERTDRRGIPGCTPPLQFLEESEPAKTNSQFQIITLAP